MAKEYKTMTFDDSQVGHTQVDEAINFYSKYGWEIKSKETSREGWSFGKTCCLGAIFLPLALLGKKDNVVHIILEREVKPDNQKLDEEMEKAQLLRPKFKKPMSKAAKVILGCIVFFVVIGLISNIISAFVGAIDKSANTETSNTTPSASPSTTQSAKRIPYSLKQVSQPSGILNYIIINPKDSNKASLLALGQELHDDFASTGFIRISIFTDIKAADMWSRVIKEEASSAENKFYDAHYVAQYNKNDSTKYNELIIEQDASGKVDNQTVDY